MKRLVRWLPRLILGVIAVGSAGTVAEVATGNQLPRALAYVALGLAFGVFGALVAARQPSNPIGWLFCASGLVWALGMNVDTYVRSALRDDADAFGATTAAWVSTWIWIPGLGMPIALAVFLGADGRLASKRWRVPFAAACAGLAMVLVGSMFERDLYLMGDEVSVPNPWAVPELGWLIALGAPLVLASVAAGAVSLLLRLRGSEGRQRQQLKWIASAFAAAAVGATVGGALWSFVDWAFVVTLFALAAIPVGIGIAILRYRLYEIDRIINRTVVYGVATAGLAGLYFGIVLLLQLVFDPITRGSDLAIAISTLTVAALFRPVRSRVQALIDRRFYRGRYDAQRAIAAFGARLREETDLDTLATELRTLVSDTVQPVRVTLWLREG